MADQSVQIGDRANLERAAAIALGVNTVASYNSNNRTNIKGANIVAINIISSPGGNEPLAGRSLENCSLADSNTSPDVDHTQEAIRCFQIMNEQLYHDILDVGVDPAQFLTNDKVLERIKLHDKVSPWLQYACTHWAVHLNEADKSSKHLVKELETFINEHLLHWIEALSWINELGSADLSLKVGIAFLESKPTLSNSLELLSEGQRLISNFGELIAQTALHTYRTALHFPPNESLLNKTYSREMGNNLSRVLSWWPKDSQGIITRSQHKHPVNHIVFSRQPSTDFASWTVDVQDSTTIVTIGNMWNSTTGMIWGSIDGDRIALSHNFRVGASSKESSVFWYKEGTRKQFTASAPVLRIALSFDGSRLAAGSSDGKIKLWNGVDGSLIQEIDGFECHCQEYCQFVFSPDETAGARLAFSSVRGGLEFLNALNGERIITPNYPSTMYFNLAFSHDGSRLASLVKGKGEKRILTVWDVVNEISVGKSPGSVGSVLAISADGSLIATGGDGHSLQLWSRNRGDTLFQYTPPNLNSWDRISYLAFSQDDILLIGFANTDSVLYSVKKRSIVAKIPKHNPSAASFSLDCTRLAIGYPDGTLDLWDVPSFEESRDTSRAKLASATILAFSPDYSRLASGFEDGTIRLWDTECPSQPLAVYKSHSAKVTTLAFRLDGASFASGAADGTIRLWDSNGVAFTDFFQFPTIEELTSVAFSGFVLAAATVYETMLWDIATGINGLLPGSTLLSFSNPNLDLHSHLLASFNGCHKGIRVWDIFANLCIARYQCNNIQTVEKMTFTSDNSQLAGTVRLDDGTESFCLFDLANKVFRYLQANEYVRHLPMPHWYGIPVWLQYSGGNYIITGHFSEDNDRSIDLKMVVLPNDLVVDSCKPCGSRMFALPCKDGRILLFEPLD